MNTDNDSLTVPVSQVHHVTLLHLVDRTQSDFSSIHQVIWKKQTKVNSLIDLQYNFTFIPFCFTHVLENVSTKCFFGDKKRRLCTQELWDEVLDSMIRTSWQLQLYDRLQQTAPLCFTICFYLTSGHLTWVHDAIRRRQNLSFFS